MEKPRVLVEEEVRQSPVLKQMLEQARARGQSLITYHGVIFSITPVEDISHAFTTEELREFAADYAAADNPLNHVTVEQALARHRQRVRQNG